MQVREEELLCLMCLGAYVLLLGRCCRGWGAEEAAAGGRRGEEAVAGGRRGEEAVVGGRRGEEAVAGGRREGTGEPCPTPDRTERQTLSSQAQGSRRPVKDPLQQYKAVGGSEAAIVVPGSPARRKSRATMGGKLDLGSFLIGVEVSLRHSHPKMTQGLFGPLTNGGWLYCMLLYVVCMLCSLCCMCCAVVVPEVILLFHCRRWYSG